MATVTHDLFPIWSALRAAMLSDADLVGMLGASDGVYITEPAMKLELPAVVFLPGNELSGYLDAGTGLWRPEVRIDVLGRNMAEASRVAGYLEQAFSIPVPHAEVESEYLVMDSLQRFGSLDLGPVLMAVTGQEVCVHGGLWSSRVKLRRTS